MNFVILKNLEPKTQKKVMIEALKQHIRTIDIRKLEQFNNKLFYNFCSFNFRVFLFAWLESFKRWKFG